MNKRQFLAAAIGSAALPALAKRTGWKAGPALLTVTGDGYAAALSMSDAQKYRFVLATHLDGAAMPLGGLGPLWAVYDADRFTEMTAKPLNARFGSCPWALYHIEVSVR